MLVLFVAVNGIKEKEELFVCTLVCLYSLLSLLPSLLSLLPLPFPSISSPLPLCLSSFLVFISCTHLPVMVPAEHKEERSQEKGEGEKERICR